MKKSFLFVALLHLMFLFFSSCSSEQKDNLPQEDLLLEKEKNEVLFKLVKEGKIEAPDTLTDDEIREEIKKIKKENLKDILQFIENTETDTVKFYSGVSGVNTRAYMPVDPELDPEVEYTSVSRFFSKSKYYNATSTLIYVFYKNNKGSMSCISPVYLTCVINNKTISSTGTGSFDGVHLIPSRADSSEQTLPSYEGKVRMYFNPSMISHLVPCQLMIMTQLGELTKYAEGIIKPSIKIASNVLTCG